MSTLQSANSTSATDLTHEKNSLFNARFMVLCSIVFVIVCNVAVYYSLHVYLKSIGFSDSNSGAVISLYSLAGMSMYAVFSNSIRKDNAFRSMGGGILLMLFSGCGFLIADSFPMLVTLRLLQGVGGFCLFAPCTVLIVSILPKGQEGAAFSLYSVGLLLPYSILPVASEMLMPYVQSPVWLYAGAALLMIPTGLLVLLLKRSLSASQTGEAEKQQPDKTATAEAFANLLEPAIMTALLANLFYFIIFTGVFFLFQDFARSRGIENAGAFFTVQMGIMICIRLGANKLFNRVRPKLLIALAFIVTSMSLAACTQLTTADGLFPVAMLFGTGMGLCTPPLNTLLYVSGNPKFRGFNANMMVLTIHTGSFLGPLAGSWIVEGVGYNTFLLGAAATTLGVAVLFFLAPLSATQK